MLYVATLGLNRFHFIWYYMSASGVITVSILLARMSVDAFYNEQTIQVCKNIFGYINVVPTSWALRFRTKAHGSIQHDKTI